MGNNIVSTVKKEPEYQAFIETVKNGEIPEFWEDLAESLHVHPNTISAWKKLPEFRKALVRGLKKSYDEMEKTGKRDWRMWRERYAMLRHEQQKGTALKVTSGDMSVEFLSYGTPSNPAPMAGDDNQGQSSV